MLRNINHVDDLTGAQVVLSEEHHMTHEGFMYHASGKVTGMVDSNVDDFLLVTPAGNYPHMQRLRFDFGAGDIDVQSYEDVTTSADGSSLSSSIVNTNRDSANTPNLTLFSGPTVTDIGTLLHTTWAPPTATGNGQSANGISQIEAGEEWILKPSTKYLVRITNNSGATISYRWELLFYEIGY